MPPATPARRTAPSPSSTACFRTADMKTPLRILIGATTAVVVFATSFAVASALNTPPELSPADPPLAIPDYTRQEAEVLLPVAVGTGAEGEGDNGLSEPSGVAEVVVPDALE